MYLCMNMCVHVCVYEYVCICANDDIQIYLMMACSVSVLAFVSLFGMSLALSLSVVAFVSALCEYVCLSLCKDK